MKYSNEELLKMYEDMVNYRVYEEVTIELLEKGKLRDGAWHLGMGMEATQIGCVSAMKPNDWYTPTHRCHGILSVYLDKRKFTAECMVRKDGYMRGKGASVHIGSKADHLLPANGILGASAPIGAGFALGLKRQGKDDVVISVTGDSATAEGNFYEALNMAAITHAPVVFVIENNLMGSATYIKDTTLLTNLSDKAAAAGLKGVTVDGNDVVAVREAMEKAIEDARKGEPSVVECKTIRYRPHSEGSADSAMDPELVMEYKATKDPIMRMENLLKAMKVVDDGKIEEIYQEARESALDAYEYAVGCDYPTFEDSVDINVIYADAGGMEL